MTAQSETPRTDDKVAECAKRVLLEGGCIMDAIDADFARVTEERDAAVEELRLRRKPMNYPGDYEAVRLSGVKLPSCSCVGRGIDDDHGESCGFWNGILEIRRKWTERHVVAWSCWCEANVGKSPFAKGKCEQWCLNQEQCPAATRDDIDIAIAAREGK